jgi:Ca2+-binding EF-hand superfamily protein
VQLYSSSSKQTTRTMAFVRTKASHSSSSTRLSVGSTIGAHSTDDTETKQPEDTTSSTHTSTIESSSIDIQRDADFIFAIIDVDGNGFLTGQELANHLSVAGYTTKLINTIFTKMDVNKDGEISKEEFRGGMAALTALQRAPGLGSYNAEFIKEIHQDADQVFQSADVDGNGTIDVFELDTHFLGRLMRLGKTNTNSIFSETAVNNIFRLLDVNGDGKVSQDEMRSAFVRYSALRQAIGEGPNYK